MITDTDRITHCGRRGGNCQCTSVHECINEGAPAGARNPDPWRDGVGYSPAQNPPTATGQHGKD